MDQKQINRKNFLVNAAYWTMILAGIYLILKYFANLIMPFLIATLFVAVARPLAQKLRSGKRKKIPYNAAAVLSVLVLWIVFGAILVGIAAPLISYAAHLVETIPGTYTNTIVPAMRSMLNRLQEFSGRTDGPLAGIVSADVLIDNITGSLGGFLTDASARFLLWFSSLATALPSFLMKSLICLIATVFIAIDYDRIFGFFRLNMPEKAQSILSDIRSSETGIVTKFIRSYLLIFLITWAEITLGLLIIGKSHPLLIGLLISIFDAFPIVGSGMILLPWAIVTGITSGFWRGAAMFLLYLVVVVVREIIEPRIVGKHVGLRPIVTLVCMYVGSRLFGIVGLFGLPIAAAVISDLNDQGGQRLFRKMNDVAYTPDQSASTVREKTDS